jgi:hypothetical protein
MEFTDIILIGIFFGLFITNWNISHKLNVIIKANEHLRDEYISGIQFDLNRIKGNIN